ncbi:MAG: L,D-transpeptidase [Patescibacteria group bacterium]
MRTIIVPLVIVILLLSCIVIVRNTLTNDGSAVLGRNSDSTHQQDDIYWFILHRDDEQEYLYYGKPNNIAESKLIRSFSVKTGRPGERPTPLPHLVGRKFWRIIDKTEVSDNPETAPYFLTLDIPAPSEAPYGPEPYNECDGQCNWVAAGEFGLHGINGDPSRLTSEDPGSSGCIRHTDEDITFLYNLLDPANEEIRYYIVD